MNKIFLIGNLTGDPELRTTPNGVSVCTMNIAVNRRQGGNRDERQTDFFRVTAWRQLGETCSRFLAKGRKIAVIGELSARTYEAKDGTTRVSLEVTADEVEFLSPREGADRGYQQGDNRGGYQQGGYQQQGYPRNYPQGNQGDVPQGGPGRNGWADNRRQDDMTGTAFGGSGNQGGDPTGGFDDVTDDDLPF